MPSTMRRHVVTGAILALSSLKSLSGCAAERAHSRVSQGNDAGRMSTLESAIKNMTANPVCESDADCRAIGFGAKACGGPKSFLYYSIRTLDETSLKTQVEEYNALARKRNRESGAISDCSIVEPQIPRCVAAAGKKKCQGTNP